MLRATLEVRPRQADHPDAFTASCELTNEGDADAVVNIAPLSSPSLALELADESGAGVPMPPPPVPPAAIPTAILAPGTRLTAKFPGFLPAWTEAGAYRVRFKYIPGTSDGRWLEGSVWSEWVEFRLG